MMSFAVNDTVTWVGKTDWELRTFHGEELSTHRGSSYNAYLVRGEDKTVLIDTVWRPFASEFIEELKKVIDLDEIDAIVANHGEVDHSGALPQLLKQIPDTPVYCTSNGVKSLKGQYHQDWNFKTVKTGDKLDLGGKELVFIQAPMLHWPDTMFTYLTEDNILFSNDAFGQHYAADPMFNDTVDECELYQEALKYYANILTPFSKRVVKKIDEILEMNLPVDMICPSHGVIWREDPLQIVEQYKVWANEYQEDQITILYDTMWKGTKHMAEAIAEGIRNKDQDVTIKIYRASTTDKNDLICEIFKSKAILVGSPTVNNGLLTSIAAIMEEVEGMRFRGKKASAFGCYGWSGESVKILTGMLEDAKFDIVQDGIRAMWSPNQEAKEECLSFGEKFVENL